MGLFGSDTKQKTKINQDWTQQTSAAQDEGIAISGGQNIRITNYDDMTIERMFDLAELAYRSAGHSFDSALNLGAQAVNPELDPTYDDRFSRITELGGTVLIVGGGIFALWLFTRRKRS